MLYTHAHAHQHMENNEHNPNQDMETKWGTDLLCTIKKRNEFVYLTAHVFGSPNACIRKYKGWKIICMWRRSNGNGSCDNGSGDDNDSCCWCCGVLLAVRPLNFHTHHCFADENVNNEHTETATLYNTPCSDLTYIYCWLCQTLVSSLIDYRKYTFG